MGGAKVEVTDSQFKAIQDEMLEELRAIGIAVEVSTSSNFESRNKRTFSVYEIMKVIYDAEAVDSDDLQLVSETRAPDGIPLVVAFNKKSNPGEGYTYIISGNHGTDQEGSPQFSDATIIDKVDYYTNGSIQYGEPLTKYEPGGNCWVRRE